MKKVIFLSISLLGFVVFIGSANIVRSSTVYAGAGEGQMIYHKYEAMWHKDVKLPLRNMALEIRDRINALLTAILEGNFESVKQNATAVSQKGQQIIDTYFPQSLDIEAYEKDPKTSHLQPEDLEKFKQLRADFLSYFGKIDASLQEIQKAADSKNGETAFDAFSGLIKNTCIDCHKKMHE
ncbi:MAG: hypothetical protein QY310_07075 [Candidatus Jettenia sp. CY-1]|nr:MAG: hypothetical protein QY310_07075 [Candidatus Jettenia sp. CY-1]